MPDIIKRQDQWMFSFVREARINPASHDGYICREALFDAADGVHINDEYPDTDSGWSSLRSGTVCSSVGFACEGLETQPYHQEYEFGTITGNHVFSLVK
jgi:hypothetical protein